MLHQQESFKLGESAPDAGDFFCLTCDRKHQESLISLTEAQPFPFCPACKAAGREEVDQLWVRLRDREEWRKREQSRWREYWKS